MREARIWVAVMVLLLTACGDGGAVRSAGDGAERSPTATVDPSDSGTGTSSSDPASPAGAVPEALQFTAAGVDGSQVSGPSFAGRDVVLWFWAPW